MRFDLTYDEATALMALLETEESEALDPVYRRLQGFVRDAWNPGSVLTPMFTPFLIAIHGKQGTKAVVRKELCNTYSPEVVTVESWGTGEVLVLDAKAFKWRHI